MAITVTVEMDGDNGDGGDNGDNGDGGDNGDNGDGGDNGDNGDGGDNGDDGDGGDNGDNSDGGDNGDGGAEWPDVDFENDSIFSSMILFDFDKAFIKEESFSIISEIADSLKGRPYINLEIQGHTDSVGTEDYNQKLSEQRARVVRKALITYGVNPMRLTTRGFGKSVPLYPNDTEEHRAKNRRTVFRINKPDK